MRSETEEIPTEALLMRLNQAVCAADKEEREAIVPAALFARFTAVLSCWPSWSIALRIAGIIDATLIEHDTRTLRVYTPELTRSLVTLLAACPRYDSFSLLSAVRPFCRLPGPIVRDVVSLGIYPLTLRYLPLVPSNAAYAATWTLLWLINSAVEVGPDHTLHFPDAQILREHKADDIFLASFNMSTDDSDQLALATSMCLSHASQPFPPTHHAMLPVLRRNLDFDVSDTDELLLALRGCIALAGCSSLLLPFFSSLPLFSLSTQRTFR
jgi:hypothetical protein